MDTVLSPYRAFLERNRAEVAERLVPPPRVVETLSVVEHVCPGSITGAMDVAADPLGHQRKKELCIAELSPTFPARLIEQVMPSASRWRWKVSLEYCYPWTPFGLSGRHPGGGDAAMSSGDDREDLAGDVPLQRADRVELRMARRDPAGDLSLRPRVSPKATDGADVQRAVGGAVAAAVQPMSRGLAR